MGGGGYYGVKQLGVAAFLIAPFPSADARFLGMALQVGPCGLCRRNNWGALIIRTGYVILSVLYNYIGLAKDTTAN